MGTALKIYTDGGCKGNPGPGGWAYVIIMQTFQGENIIAQEKGGAKNTTNNKMELTAVIGALKKLKTMSVPRQVTVYTDSQYVQKGISEWIKKWKRNSWRTSDRRPVKNQELWIELDSLIGDFLINWQWIKGHAGNEYNELCDQMTNEAIAEIF